MSREGNGIPLKPVKTRPFFLKPSFLLLFSFLMVLGAVLTWWVVWRTDRTMRAELLQQTRFVAQSLNVDRVLALTGTQADTLRPDYHRLKKQFAALKQFNEEYHFIYLMAPADDGTIIFLVDNEPSGAPDESLPGMVYYDAPDGFHRAMDSGVSGVEGPFRDRWGTFVSGYVPLTDPLTDNVLALLAVDYNAGAWKQSLVRAAYPPILLTMMLTALLLIASYLFARRSRIVSQTSPLMRNLEPVVVAAIGLALSLFAGWMAHIAELSTTHEAFMQLASGQTAGVADKLYEIRDTKLESLARFYEGSISVTPEEFSRFTMYLTKNPNVYSWGWAKSVPASDVSRFVDEIRSTEHADFQIWELDSAWNRVPAVGRDVYYPVMRIVPFVGSAPIVGFDIASQPKRYASLNEAASTGLITFTNLVERVGNGEEKNILLIYRPVFSLDDSKQVLGFAIAGLHTENFLKNAVHDSSAIIEFSIVHQNAEPELLATSGKSISPIGNLKLTRPVLAYGKTFSVTAYAGKTFMRSHPQRLGWMTALAGIFITVALTVTTSVLNQYHRQLQKLVLKRTADLRESEERLSATLRSIGDGVVACDANGNVESINAVAETLTGWENGSARGLPVRDILHIVNAETREGIELPVARALSEDRIITFGDHMILIARDGTEYHIADSCSPIHDTSGAIIGTVLVFRDVTDEIRQREMLHASEERHRMLFDNALAAITTCEIIVDEAGNPIDYVYLSVNPAYEKITGLCRDDVVGHRFTEVVGGVDNELIVEKFAKVVRSGEPTSFEYYVEEIDRYFYINAYRLNEKQFATVFSDVTQRKKAEEEKAFLEIQLLQAQKMEAVGRLAGGVAHDFNNMLSVIIGNTELMLESLDSASPFRVDLMEIQSAAKHSADLTQQLLAYARKQTVIPEVLDLNATTGGMLTMLRQLIGENIELVWLPGSDLWLVAIDPSQVDQILVNLCVNARDAIANVGTITIKTGNITFDEEYAATHRDVAAGDYVMITVNDDGKGMDTDTLNNIFEPFYTTKKTGEGTGLGLATVYGIVQQNEGFIVAESEPGKGTTFSIYLPRKTGNNQVVSPGRQKDVSISGNETILVAEDEPAILKMTKNIFEHQGYTVLAANSPDEAIRLAEKYDHDIHLLITDVVMPGMNGRELSQSLNVDHPRIKTLFMSGYTADVIAHHGVVNEGVNFIQKPFSMAEITTKVRQVLDAS